jgi:hypothetical protein
LTLDPGSRDGLPVRPALVSYFDLGVSFGLGDRVFDPEYVAPIADLGTVGLVNPLGSGLHVDLGVSSPQALASWRAAASAQVTRPEMETGWSETLGISRNAFDDELRRHVNAHVIQRCEMTIYSIGTVYLSLEFDAGVDPRYVTGLLDCFEFAAYTPPISDTLFAIAYGHAARAVGHRQRGLVELSRRTPSTLRRDASGYQESELMRSFTTLLLCIDDEDAAQVADLAAAWQVAGADNAIDFEYHGKLHFGWAACLLEPRHYAATAPAQQHETPREQVARMLTCIQIAHVFLGTCEAYTRLFQDEIQQQVGGYVDEAVAGRDPEELNRLRTLALAVVNLTQFNLVAQAEEDRAYFTRFAAASNIDMHHKLIQDACEMLHNVQVAERQHQDTKRQNLLNSIVLLLTSLTLVSVTVDAYNFVREEQPLIADRISRAQVLTEFVLALGLLISFVIYLSRPTHKQQRRKPRRTSQAP